jgi:GDPmannose 4,6-dehydratase
MSVLKNGKKKRALITGVTGQDGAYLADFLLKKGYKVYGTYRRSSTPNFWRLQTLKVLDKIILISADMTDFSSLMEAVTVSNPDEIYNLAAQSYVGSSFDQPFTTAYVDGLGPLALLEIIRHLKKRIKYYQASTSELFGANELNQQGSHNESCTFIPNSPYATAKLYGYHLVRIYREAYGIFACNGILFNHESPLRGLEFVTRKITNSVAKIKLGMQKKLYLGNLDSKRDWGFAPDYVEAMWLILQQDSPDDYVIATGETHSVMEFVEEAFRVAGLDWKKYVESSEKLKRPVDVNYLKGDYSKAKKVLGWEPKTNFKELIKKMVGTDIARWKKSKRGIPFPWDALNYDESVEIISRSRER